MPINWAINVVSLALPGGGGGGVYSWDFVVGVCRPVLLILTLFQTETLSFSTLVFRPGTRFSKALGAFGARKVILCLLYLRSRSKFQ